MKLIIEDDEGRKTVVPFVRDEITIGRQEGNTIRLTERNVSRRHARLLRQNGHILVEDLGSYNGIRINGDRIQGQVQVNEGDLIQIGDYDLAVQREASEAAAAPAAAHHHTDKTQEVEALQHARGNGASAGVPTRPLPDNGATIPVLPTVEPTAPISGEEPEEANPDDVTLQPQAAISEEAQAAARRQSTAIIRMDQVEQNRPRQIADIDAAEAPRLIVINTELAGREYSCVRTELKIGRTDENDIAIDHRSLSRTHCKIVREDSGEWRVIDMQSANGLMVNGESYAQSALRHGDVLELGHVKMKFVGAGEKYDAADAVAEAAGGKMGVFVAVGVVALCVIAGGGFAWIKYGKSSGTKSNPPVVDPNPKTPPKVDNPQQPEELTPEQQRAQIEGRLKEAREKIDALDWAGATEILKTCYVGESLHPEAQRLLVALKEEEALRAAIEKADQLIDQDKLPDAKEALDSASHTKFLMKRFNEVSEKLGKATERKLLQARAPEQPKQPPPQQPPPQPVPVKQPPPPQPAGKGTAEMLEEARAFNKNKEYPKAKVLLEKCVKTEPKNAECWKLLGVVFTGLGDGASGAKAYEKFLELAPDHPQAAKVRAILEQYRGSK